MQWLSRKGWRKKGRAGNLSKIVEGEILKQQTVSPVICGPDQGLDRQGILYAVVLTVKAVRGGSPGIISSQAWVWAKMRQDDAASSAAASSL